MNTLVNQRIFLNKQNTQKVTKGTIIFNQKIEELKSVGEDLADVKGFGPYSIKILYENGVKTTEQLKQMSDEWIKNKIKSPLAVKNITDYIHKLNEIGATSEQ